MIGKTSKRSFDAISNAVVYVEGKEVSLVEEKDAAERVFLQNMPFATTKEKIISSEPFPFKQRLLEWKR